MFSNLENRESVLGIRRGYLNISTLNIYTAQRIGDFAPTQSLVSQVTLKMSTNPSVPDLSCIIKEQSHLF